MKTLEELHAELERVQAPYNDRMETLEKTIKDFNDKAVFYGAMIAGYRKEYAETRAKIRVAQQNFEQVAKERRQATLEIRTEIWRINDEIRRINQNNE